MGPCQHSSPTTEIMPNPKPPHSYTSFISRIVHLSHYLAPGSITIQKNEERTVQMVLLTIQHQGTLNLVLVKLKGMLWL